MDFSPWELPDGRQPLRFGKGRTAFYIKARGSGIVEYTFSMIRHIQIHRPRKSPEEVSRIRRLQADKMREENPNYFSEIGTLGGKVTKNDRKNIGDEESQGEPS